MILACTQLPKSQLFGVDANCVVQIILESSARCHAGQTPHSSFCGLPSFRIHFATTLLLQIIYTD